MNTLLTTRFDEALGYAHDVHRAQNRRGAPMIAHLLEVAGLVLQFGGLEEEGIGALLHDAAEDAGGRERLADIRHHFGDRVAEIVNDCTDSFDDPSPPWLDRKREYVAHLGESSRAGLLVSAVDKLCNVRQLSAALRSRGHEAWQDFEGGREGRLWYYRALADAFAVAGRTAALAEFTRAVDELEMLARSDAGGPPGA